MQEARDPTKRKVKGIFWRTMEGDSGGQTDQTGAVIIIPSVAIHCSPDKVCYQSKGVKTKEEKAMRSRTYRPPTPETGDGILRRTAKRNPKTTTEWQT